ncbi:MAG TPA: aminotransferase class IV [Candidatus Paceibacterota bacterium]|nr:aminotransferase class IV [Candidatus Paceibacterota bacterium]
MKGIVFDAQKRAFIPLEKAAVPITDIAFQRAAGVFETLLSYNGKPFHLREHLKRLQVSAKLLGIKEHYLLSYLEEKVRLGLGKIKAPIVSVKIIITGGDSSYLSLENDPRLYIIFNPFNPEKFWPKYAFEKGVSLLTTPILRTLPSVKSLNYVGAVVSNQTAVRKKYYDSLYATKDHILEGTTFNFAIIIKNNLITPADQVLDGITMQVAMKLAKKIGLNVFEKNITFKELRQAEEAFLTSSYREVMPVVRVDNIKIGSGRPGPYSQRLEELYRAETQK